MQTPLTVDTYSRFMADLFDERQLVACPTVWQQFFKWGQTTYSPDSEVVDIDIIRASGEELAALIHRGTDSRALNKQRNTELERFSSFSRVYPFAEELGDISASQLNKRMAGENPYEPVSQESRMRMRARNIHMEHIRRYARLFEVLAGLSLLGGAHPAITGSTNTDNWYDFRRNAAHIVSPTIPWDAAGADIMADWDSAFDIMRANGHETPDVAFAGANVIPVIFDDAKIKEWADLRRYSLIYVGSEGFNLPAKYNDLVAAGATALAKFTTPRGRVFYLFGYSDIWTDDNGNNQPYMPLNSFFFGKYQARCDRYFGPKELLPDTPTDAAWYQQMFGMNMNAPMMPPNIKNMNGIITPAMFYCDAYRSNDKKKVTIRTQSAPIYATTQTDAFFTYYGCLVQSS